MASTGARLTEFSTNNYGDRNVTYNNSIINNHPSERTGPPPARSGIEILAGHIAPTALHSSTSRNARTGCQKGTRVGVIEKLTSWVEDPSKKHRVCWVSGGAGVGKSAIAQTICENARRKSQLAASFFFSRSDTSRSTIDPFFPTLSHQLATTPEFQNAGLSSFTERAVPQTPNGLENMNLEGQFQSLIFQPCAQIDRKRWKTLPKLIVIDGLDECMGGSDTSSGSNTISASDAQETLLSIICTATSTEPPLSLHFMIFSRPEPAIRDLFQTVLASHEPVDMRNYRAGADSDIKAYLDKQFNNVVRSHPGILAKGVWPGKETTSQLVHKADGHFIYVVTVVKYITSSNPSPADLRERLDIVLRTKETTSHPDLSDLDQLYHTILQRFSNVDFHTQLLLPLLQCVIIPLPAGLVCFNIRSQRGIAALLKIDFHQCSALLSQLRSVLHIPDDPYNVDISILHASFSDFLGDGQRSREFQVHPSHNGSRVDQFCCCLVPILRQQLHQHQRDEWIEPEDQRLELFSLYPWDTIGILFQPAKEEESIAWHVAHDKYSPSKELLSAVVAFDLYGYLNMILDRFVLVPVLFDSIITYTSSKWATKTFQGCKSMNWKRCLFSDTDYNFRKLHYHKHLIGSAAKHREFLHCLFKMLLKNVIYIQEVYTILKNNGTAHHSYFEDDWLVILLKDRKDRKISLSRLGCIAVLGILPEPYPTPDHPNSILKIFPQIARDSWSVASLLTVLPHAELEQATTKFSGDKFEFFLVTQQQRAQLAGEFVEFIPTYDNITEELTSPLTIMTTATWDNLLKILTSTLIGTPPPNGDSDSKEVVVSRGFRGRFRISS
ncbi:hypothetical protein PM082_014588 [Marasmius tenuissimus]|nr:hypothetical protein PM082_014588 [Marasmius tenuissimus]